MKGSIIVGTLVAFLAGALAWILPPHILGRIDQQYPETTWRWLGDAVWNMQPAVSVPISMVIGFVYGLLIPKCWYLCFFATWYVVPFNFILDVAQFPKSHNLWPFEMLLFAVFNSPIIVTAWLGKRARHRYWR